MSGQRGQGSSPWASCCLPVPTAHACSPWKIPFEGCSLWLYALPCLHSSDASSTPWRDSSLLYLSPRPLCQPHSVALRCNEGGCGKCHTLHLPTGRAWGMAAKALLHPKDLVMGSHECGEDKSHLTAPCLCQQDYTLSSYLSRFSSRMLGEGILRPEERGCRSGRDRTGI